MARPDGVVTFLFTDIEGSTRLWEESSETMMTALVQHDDVIERAAASHGATLVRPRGEGDSRFLVFPDATGAVAAVVEIQRGLAAIDWDLPRPLRVRVALHSGTANLRLGDYYGSAVNRAARLRAIAHGGQTVMSAATWELTRDDLPPGVAVRDLGAHLLKDLNRPEHVFQLDIDGLDTEFPPLASLSAVPNNLPIQLTSFVGREAELDQAVRALDGTRLLTILAPGGAGKTRLAIQVAAELTSRFPDGVFFIDLAPITSADDVIQTVAESLGIALSTDEDLLTQLLAYLGTKRRLLLFDNFEHVVEGAGLLTEILKGAPQVTVIATSRTKLNVAGETIMTITGLETEWESSEDAERTSGVQLFVEAATRADATFDLADGDMEPLHRILRLVDGMPLGIELAAAWVDVLPIGDIAAEIAKSLDFLESESSGVPDRHRSMRAVFDYSWSMLTEDERATFGALSVFRGGFTREAAEAVAGASVRKLSGLVSKSLVIADRDSGRYAVHELLRQYAESSLQQGGIVWDEVADAHAAFFADRAAHAEHLLGASDQKQALHIVEDDLDNMRAAWRRSLATRNAVQARKFIFALWFLHDIRAWHQAAVSLFGEALAAFDDADSSDPAVRIVRASSSSIQGWFTSLLGRPQEGMAQAAEAVDVLADLPDLLAYVMAVQYQCVGLMYLGRNEELRAVSAEAVRRAKEAGNAWLAAVVQSYLAASEIFLGNVETGLEIIEQAEAVLTALDEHRKLSMFQVTKSFVAIRQKRTGDAIEILKAVLRNANEIGFRRMTQMALQQLGEAYLAAEDLEAAETAFLQSLAMSEETGLALEIAGAVATVARVRAKMGQQEDAVSMLASVLADPINRQMMIYDNDTIADIATELLAEIGREMEPDMFAAARARGAAIPLQVTAKQLLAEAE